MKKLILGSLLAVGTLFITSCLDGGSNEQSGMAYGVIGHSEKTYQTIIKSTFGPCYSPNIANDPNISPNDCCAFSFSIDYDLPENSNEAVVANGYYTVAVTQYSPVDRYQVAPYLTDTATILQDEMTVNSVDFSGLALVEDMIFIPTYHEGVLQDQKQRFELSYDSNQEPESIGGENVYNLYLRVVKTADGKGATQSVGMLNAFNIEYFLSSFGQKEKAAGNKVLGFKFNFAKEIDEEKAEIKWATSQVVKYSLQTEEDKK